MLGLAPNCPACRWLSQDRAKASCPPAWGRPDSKATAGTWRSAGIAQRGKSGSDTAVGGAEERCEACCPFSRATEASCPYWPQAFLKTRTAAC